MTAILVPIPISAGGSLTRRKNAPTRKTPSTGPLIRDAMESAWSRADRFR
jgi:hypothetical protein